jgi:hypothetical protein
VYVWKNPERIRIYRLIGAWLPHRLAEIGWRAARGGVVMRNSHLLVFHDDPDGRHGRKSHAGARLVVRLRRMAVGRITAVSRIEEVKHLCSAGGIDACLVVIGDAVPDSIPTVLAEAPGQAFGIPTLIVAPAVTPHLRKTARLCGYRAVLSAKIAPRMLYRRVGAVLQGRRRPRPQVSGRMVMTAPTKAVNLGKPTVH